MSTPKKRERRGNGEGSKPVQRKDGRWQVGIRYTVDGLGKRTTVTGRTTNEARRRPPRSGSGWMLSCQRRTRR